MSNKSNCRCRGAASEILKDSLEHHEQVACLCSGSVQHESQRQRHAIYARKLRDCIAEVAAFLEAQKERIQALGEKAWDLVGDALGAPNPIWERVRANAREAGSHRESVSTVVVRLLAEQLSVDPALIKPSSIIVDDLGADSLDTVELVMVIEEAFEIEISDEDAEQLVTVLDVVQHVEQRLVEVSGE